MGASVGGDITEVTFNHPTLGTATILPKSAEDSAYDLGGFRIKDEAEGITGRGDAIIQMNCVRWSFETTVAWDMNSRTDLEKIVALSASPVPADWTISHINGTVHGASGWPVGDQSGNGNAATFKLKVAGGGKLKKIVG